MKLFKKILWLGAVLATTIGFGTAIAACNGDNTTSSSSSSSTEVDTDNLDFAYRVTVQNDTGFGLSGVTVKLMNGETEVASVETNRSGNANFLPDEIELGTYSVEIEAPKGYEITSDSLTTADKSGTVYPITVKPTGVIMEEAPVGTTYKLGDVMYDFSISLSDGTNYTLSEVLKTKDMVFLNFWATWCGPCKAEFPAMHNVATAYESTVSVLAISTTDAKASVTSFKASEGLTKFNMAAAGSGGLATMFSVSSIPHSIIIDRYGVIAFNHVGSMPSEGAFTSRFDQFVGEDYEPTIIGQATEEEEGGSSGEENIQIKPNVAAPAVSDLKSAFVSSDGTANGFNFRYQEDSSYTPDHEKYDEYNWPWTIEQEADGTKYLSASNREMHNSYAILYSTVHVEGGDVLTFDYKIGTEEGYDIFYVMLDNMIIKQYSGNLKDKWNTSYAYVFKDYEAGNHEIAFVYLKDSDTAYPTNGDIIQIKNLRIGDVNNLADVEESVDIFRNAAAGKPDDNNTQFKYYADVRLNTEDRYYHVFRNGEDTGEVLYANIMNASLWNTTSLWLLAYEGYVVGDGMNYHSAVNEFAWEAAQVTDVYGYAPVTEDLKYLLDAAVKFTTYGQKWEGKYHENEWLELCVYWEHYGNADLPPDPMAGITFSSAIPLDANYPDAETPVTNKVNVPYAISPRGFKYKFTPKMSGAYHVYSTGTSDSVVFLMEDDRKTMLGNWDNKVFADVIIDEDGTELVDGNFEFYWYFEKDVTYYLLFTTYLDQVAEYNVNIDYIAETYTYLENAAVGPYSANLVTFELFLPDAIEFTYADPAQQYRYADDPDKEPGLEYNGDGYYHQLKEDGSLGGIIYLDVNRPTALFTTKSLYDYCREADAYEKEKRAFYVTIDGQGVDLTPEIKKLCFKANLPSPDKPRGFIAVDKDVFNLLDTLLMSSKYDGIDSTWLLLCYYDKTLKGN